MPTVNVCTLFALVLSSVPALPPPPAPASPAQQLASQLVAGLLSDAEALPATSVYRVDVQVTGSNERLGP
ncbi:MAG: hypothetical protein QF464_15755, partial [Myxococcota bacterium]|nr:hypothetical protein [Myxococcota bacterium]